MKYKSGLLMALGVLFSLGHLSPAFSSGSSYGGQPVSALELEMLSEYVERLKEGGDLGASALTEELSYVASDVCVRLGGSHPLCGDMVRLEAQF